MVKRWVGLPHRRKSSRLLLLHGNTMNLGRYKDNTLQGVGPDSGKVLTHHDHILRKTGTRMQNKTGMVAYLGGVTDLA